MVKVVGVGVRDVRFGLPPGDGTDSVHSLQGRVYYGYAVTVLETDRSGVQGQGIAFTLGGGTELVCQAIQHLSPLLTNMDVEDTMAQFGAFSRTLADHPTLRWLGPHNGVVHLALASITNAFFDLWAKCRGVPLHALLLSLPSVAVVRLLDLSFVDDQLSEEAAVALLERERPSRKEREDVLRDGIPAYDTSCGWMDCSDSEVKKRCAQAVANGFRAVKLKVGRGSDADVRRLQLVREVVGDKVRVAVDANQQWSLHKALDVCARLKEGGDLLWVEEPTHPHDVQAHVAIAKAIAPTPVAVGEAIPNRVVFKNFMQAGAVQICQIDPTRLAGVAECLTCALLARQHNLRVIPHVGDMGQISQHLVLFYHIALNIPLEFLEHIPHLSAFFVDPARVEGGVYRTPEQPGASCAVVTEADAKQAVASGLTHTVFFEGRVDVGLSA